MRQSRRSRVAIVLGVVLFFVALAGSAFLVPQLRLLHSLQALLYVAILLLALRNSPWGFGAGTIMAAAWNYLEIFVTHLMQAGFGQIALLIRTGHVTRPDTVMVPIGVIGHVLLIIGCLTEFLRVRPGFKAWASFLAGGLLSLGYLALIVRLTAP